MKTYILSLADLSVLTSVREPGRIASCSFYSNGDYIVTASSEKRISVFRLSANRDLDLVATFPARAGFGSPDGIGGGLGLGGDLLCCGDQGGRIYLLRLVLK